MMVRLMVVVFSTFAFLPCSFHRRSNSSSPVRSPSPHALSSTPIAVLHSSPAHLTHLSPAFNRSISKTRHQAIDVLSEYKQRESTSKAQINLVVVGEQHCYRHEYCVSCNADCTWLPRSCRCWKEHFDGPLTVPHWKCVEESHAQVRCWKSDVMSIKGMLYKNLHLEFHQFLVIV